VTHFGMRLESPEISGRVISALYDDPLLAPFRTLPTAEIAERHGVFKCEMQGRCDQRSGARR